MWFTIVLLSVFLAIPLLVRLSRRFGKGRAGDAVGHGADGECRGGGGGLAR